MKSYLYLENVREPRSRRKYIKIIKEMYRNTTATVQLEQQGEEFRVQRGVRQGNPLSPKLLTAVLENIFRN